MTDKVKGHITVMNIRINTEFDAEILEDGSLKIRFKDAIIIPPDRFIIGELLELPKFVGSTGYIV